MLVDFFFYDIYTGNEKFSIQDIFSEISDISEDDRIVDIQNKKYEMIIVDDSNDTIRGRLLNLRSDAPRVRNHTNKTEKYIPIEPDEDIIESTYFMIKNKTLVMQRNSANGGTRTGTKLAAYLNQLLSLHKTDVMKNNRIRVSFIPKIDKHVVDKLLELDKDLFSFMELRPYVKSEVGLVGYILGRDKDGNENRLEIGDDESETASIRIKKNSILSKIREIHALADYSAVFSSIIIRWTDRNGNKSDINLITSFIHDQKYVDFAGENRKDLNEKDCCAKMIEITKMDVYAQYFI